MVGKTYTDEDREREWLRCQASPAYFVDRYVQIYDKIGRGWVPFRLWRCQWEVLQAFDAEQQVVVLKARQLGLSWLALGFYGLWRPLFEPIAKVGIFSKRDDEAVYLLGDERLKGMYARLPAWLQARKVERSDAHSLVLSNGSSVRAFPTTAGDSYALTDVVLDEFDLVPDQGGLMRSVKATVDGGGSMALISRADKSRPRTEFKRVYRGARAGRNGWHAIFLPWHAHPLRDQGWYARTRAEIEDRTGGVDELFEQYPATDDEALAPRSLDKRVRPVWLRKCFVEESPPPAPPVESTGGEKRPAIPGLRVFRRPVEGRSYVVGADPAEGNPSSDDSALAVTDVGTGEEAANLAGKFEPAVFGAHLNAVGRWYNRAGVLVERNNHGHAVLLWLRDNCGLQRLLGPDGAEGWLDNSRGKSLLWDFAADTLRDGDAVIHDADTRDQVQSVEGASLKAPSGEHDDRAMAWALAQRARSVGVLDGEVAV